MTAHRSAAPKSKAARKKAVLEALQKTPEYEVAARMAGVSRKALYLWRQEDGEFAEACESARQVPIAELGHSLYERALNKDRKHDERTSALLGMFLMKGERPQLKDSYRPEVSVREVRFTFEIPKPEGLRRLPEHVIEGEVISAD